MFIDKVRILVRAGSGGKGCLSLHRDRRNRKGIPDGGDGGKGADIIIRANRNLHTLLDFTYNKHFYGTHGGHGLSNNKKGKDAAAHIIQVPVGTTIKDIRLNCILRDLDHDGQELVVASGGAGGLGSRKVREGIPQQPGEEKELVLDLKLIADVGLVGFPNAGKSTLISNISHAHPKIAAYPFTTKFPILGVVSCADKSFAVADIPGLIEGSAQGRGLGDKFLRHVERNKLLVHIIDMAGCDNRDPLEDYKIINKELKDYSPEVSKKPQILVANKMDLEDAADNLKRFRKVVKKKIYPISALKKEGLEGLIEAIRKKL
ncbi:MAG: GTPase ObgE [Candidatus Omnitrophica bacterium]|nr:GTPase ObgE [Candidatus Omnitrophota bacterium]